MTNDQLQLDVAAELFWDPKVGSAAIAVSANGGIITLRGTVGSLERPASRRGNAARAASAWEHRWGGDDSPARQTPEGQMRARRGALGGVNHAGPGRQRLPASSSTAVTT
jgi:hypothetical protein